MQKFVQVSAQFPYFVQGEAQAETAHVWVVFHGYGQLAQYFLRKFDFLPSDHFVIAPQGNHKFYIQPYDKVGASWLTKEDRLIDIENQQIYLKKVFETETQNIDFQKVKLHLLGFSQGVATVSRWAIQHKIAFDSLILWAGGFPSEIQKTELDFSKPDTRVELVIGKADEFYNEMSVNLQIEKLKELGLSTNLTIFEGKHEIDSQVLHTIVDRILET